MNLNNRADNNSGTKVNMLSDPMRGHAVIKADARVFCLSVKEAAKRTALETTMHGLPYIVQSPNWFFRIMWIVFTLGSTGVCTMMMIQSIQNYLTYEVVSNTETLLEIPSPFPQVIVCNINRFATNDSLAFVEEVFEENGLSNGIVSSNSLLYSLYNSYFLGANAYGSNLSLETRESFGYKIDDMLISCIFNLEPCDSSWFTLHYDVYYGNCYKFNWNGSLYSRRPGAFNGLQLELFVGNPSLSSTFATSYGANIIINNYTSNPTYFEGFTAQTGAFTQFGVSRTVSEKLASPYSECQNDIEQLTDNNFVKSTIQKFGIYDQTKCFDACFEKFLIPKCGCQDLSAPPLIGDTSPWCVNFTQISCAIARFSEFYNKNIDPYCVDQCPLECNKTIYSVTVSSASYPNTVYYQRLKNNSLILRHFDNNASAVTYEALERSVLGVNVFYPDLRYTHVTESAKIELEDLIGSVGGTLGLFIGISFLSFVECLDLLLVILIEALKLIHKRAFKNTARTVA